MKKDESRKNRFKPFKSENDYKYWYAVIDETLRAMGRKKLKPEVCLRISHLKLTEEKKNAAKSYYKEFTSYDNWNTAIQAMKIGAKWPPDTKV